MCPELTIPLFGAEIKSYTLFTVLGALTFAAAALPLMKRAGVKPLSAFALIIAMAAAFLIGARLWNFAVNPDGYGRALKWYSFRLAGFSLYGGVLGSALALFVWSRLNRKPLPQLLDVIVVPSALAFALARVGCFLNGCCYGVYTNSVWGVEFPVKSGAQEMINVIFPRIVPVALPSMRYPTQLFELALALIGLIPALVFGRRLKSCSVFLLYGAWFSLMRLVILPLRSLPYSDIIKNAAYPALYLTLTALAVIAIIIINRRQCQIIQ